MNTDGLKHCDLAFDCCFCSSSCQYNLFARSLRVFFDYKLGKIRHALSSLPWCVSSRQYNQIIVPVRGATLRFRVFNSKECCVRYATWCLLTTDTYTGEGLLLNIFWEMGRKFTSFNSFNQYNNSFHSLLQRLRRLANIAPRLIKYLK
jgi:hypothetical protein